jgi:hypothetical protein
MRRVAIKGVEPVVEAAEGDRIERQPCHVGRNVPLFAPRAQTLINGQSIDLALDVKERVDAFDGSKAIGEIRVALLPRRAFGQLKELASWNGAGAG